MRRGNICPLLRSPWKSVTNLENGILPKSLLYCNCHKTIFSVDHSIPYLLYVWSWKRGIIGRILLFLDFFSCSRTSHHGWRDVSALWGLLIWPNYEFSHYFFSYSTSVSLKITETFGALLNSILSFSSEFHKLVIHCMQSCFKFFNCGFVWGLFFFFFLLIRVCRNSCFAALICIPASPYLRFLGRGFCWKS